MIKYENGDKDVFGTDKASDPAPYAVVPSSGAPAIIYFYRPGKFVGSSPEIIVGTFVPDEVIVKLRNNHWFKAEYFYTGQREFITGVYAINGAKLSVNIEGGETYYIRCSLIKGMGVQSQLEIVNEETGRKEMTSLKQQERAKQHKPENPRHQSSIYFKSYSILIAFFTTISAEPILKCVDVISYPPSL